jgi:hypothetical protein
VGDVVIRFGLSEACPQLEGPSPIRSARGGITQLVTGLLTGSRTLADQGQGRDLLPGMDQQLGEVVHAHQVGDPRAAAADCHQPSCPVLADETVALSWLRRELSLLRGRH